MSKKIDKNRHGTFCVNFQDWTMEFFMQIFTLINSK